MLCVQNVWLRQLSSPKALCGLWCPTMKTIRFSAAEDWTVEQLQTLLHALNIAYNRLYVLEFIAPGRRGKLDSLLMDSLSRVPDCAVLSIDSLEIHSPAKVSLKGLDKVVLQLRGLIRDIWFQNQLEKRCQQDRLLTQSATRDSHPQSHLLCRTQYGCESATSGPLQVKASA